MLVSLSLKNFLLVKQATINFSKGITVLTGETGAGKSILINALSLVLGSRGSKSWVGLYGKEASISAIFEPDSKTSALLDSLLIDSDEPILLRRVLNKDGKTRAFINDTPVTIKTLRLLGEQLVDIYGQHSHYALLKSEVQRQTLDSFGDYNNELQLLSQEYFKWLSFSKEYQKLKTNAQSKRDKLELLQYQLEEFEQLAIENNEFDHLENEQQQLATASALINELQLAIDHIYSQDNSAISVIEAYHQQLSEFVDIYPHLKNACSLLSESTELARDAVNELKNINVTVDPEALSWVEQRISHLFELARKHNCKPNELLNIQDKLQSQYQQLKTSKQNQNALKLKIQQSWQKLNESADNISKQRQQTALQLSKKVTKLLPNLAMQGATLSIELNPLTEAKINQFGKDYVDFQIETNPGFGFKKLAESASGGELSRIGLAVQICTKNSSVIDTLVMDEIDVGIGGKTVTMVGNLLKQLSLKSQIICVTHLPHIASIATKNIKIEKNIEQETVSHSIIELTEQQRSHEIARMLGGEDISEKSLVYAEEMLANANKPAS